MAQVSGIQLKLIRILAEELDTNEDISPLEPHKVYYLPTPNESWDGAIAPTVHPPHPELALMLKAITQMLDCIRKR